MHSCEICGCKHSLNKHHITERTDTDCTDHPMNLAIICANCHGRVHEGQIEIIGIYPSTKPPNGRTLIYQEVGAKVISDISEPYFVSKAPKSKLPGDFI